MKTSKQQWNLFKEERNRTNENSTPQTWYSGVINCWTVIKVQIDLEVGDSVRGMWIQHSHRCKSCPLEGRISTNDHLIQCYRKILLQVIPKYFDTVMRYRVIIHIYVSINCQFLYILKKKKSSYLLLLSQNIRK